MIDAVIAFALLASAISANKLVLCAMPATLFVAVRMLSAGALLLLYTAWKDTKLTYQDLKRDFFKIIIIAITTNFIPSLLKAYALKGLASSKAALLGSLDPFVTALYGFMLFGERLSRKQWLGILVGFMGAFILIITTSCTEESLRAWWIFSYPELAALSAVAVSRLGWIEAQKLLKAERFKPTELNGFTMVAGGFYALGSAWYAGQITPVAWTMPVVCALIYTIVVGNVIAYSLYGYLLKRHSSTYVSLAGLMIPLFVHCYGPVVLGEPLSPIFFCSLGCMFFGLWLFSGKTGIQSAS